MRLFQRRRAGLVLSGGGARGLAHVGVIRVLEKNGIMISGLSGASMGALIGGIYAQDPDTERLNTKVVGFIKSHRFKKLGVQNLRDRRKREPDDIIRQLTDRVRRRLIINIAANRIALLRAERLRLAVNDLLDPGNIEDCQIPFACVAADLLTGNEVVFKHGHIQPAVEGSSAIPGFLPPVPYNNYLLIDGSVINNFPVEPLKQFGMDVVIAVDVSLNFEKYPKIDNVIDLVMRSSQITIRKLGSVLKKEADIIIRPEIGDIHWSEFNRVDSIIKAGEDAAERMLPEIHRIISPVKSFFMKPRGKKEK
jgi:NTE family protein